MIVVDTNIICYLFISGEYSEQAEKLLKTDSDWHAPILWRSEIRNVLSQYLRKRILNMDDILQIMQHADDLLKNNEYEVQSSSVMQLVNSSSCSAYDCEFVALAQHLGVSLITADKKVLREFPDTAVSLVTHLG
ncbi:MAG: VapC toxin family PIN domain ribonuclease [Piscirickettsiaceae bacterium]|nr:MAG: VapC toxin family PIN domain ribonuclease [Piscirickettsiaceae bacterium]